MDQPLIAGNHSLVGASSSRIQVIEDVLLQPSVINPNDSVGVNDDEMSTVEMRMNLAESEAPYLYGFERGKCRFSFQSRFLFVS